LSCNSTQNKSGTNDYDSLIQLKIDNQIWDFHIKQKNGIDLKDFQQFICLIANMTIWKIYWIKMKTWDKIFLRSIGI
jgi:hypothetical protein